MLRKIVPSAAKGTRLDFTRSLRMASFVAPPGSPALTVTDRAPIGDDALASLYTLVARMIVHNRGTAVPRLGAMLLYERKRKSPETSELVSGLFRLCSCTIMRATRFELATFWSVARRSIQLSYARIALFSNASVILQKRRANVKHQFEFFIPDFYRLFHLSKKRSCHIQIHIQM